MRYVAREPQRPITDTILKRPRVNVHAGMGMGKTGAVLDALDLLDVAEDLWPALVIGPLNVAAVTWPDELAKWDHLARWRSSPVLGDPGARMKALRADASHFTVNFENVPWLVDQFKKRPWPFRTVIFDESTRLGGFRLKQGSAQPKALATVAHVRVNRWINLTGTPALAGLQKLWGPNWFVDEGERLGRTWSAFRDRWFHNVPVDWVSPNGQVTKQYPQMRPVDWAKDEIAERIRDVTVSLRTCDYYPDLKEPIRNVVKVRLPTKALIHYREMEKKYFTEIRGHEIEAVHAGAKSIKCLQIASGAVYDAERGVHVVHDAKLQGLKSVLEEASGAPVLAIYHWQPTLNRMLKAFPRAVHIKSAESIRLWNAGKIELGLAHPQSIGHGISMQDGGNIICHVDHWWSTETHAQINERLGPLRQLQSGYDRDVFEHYIVAEGTLDEDVMFRHEQNVSLQDALMRAMSRRGY